MQAEKLLAFYAARSSPGLFTFFSSMARSRKRRSQFESGVSFMLSGHGTHSSRITHQHRNPRIEVNPSFFTRALIAGSAEDLRHQSLAAEGGKAKAARAERAGRMSLVRRLKARWARAELAEKQKSLRASG